MDTRNSNARLNGLKSKLMMAAAICTLGITSAKSYAQNNQYNQNNQPNRPVAFENYGNTFNLGFGYIYSDYQGGFIPIVMANYEFNVAHNFTLAPFIGIGSYTSGNDYYYSNQYYYSRETIVPLGIKGTYYFDRLLNLNRRWDLYAAASLGYVYDNINWQNGYEGASYATNSPVFLDLHVGAEYHVTRRLGLFADLAAGNSSVSTVGLAFHHW